jgi:hypothetical protein
MPCLNGQDNAGAGPIISISVFPAGSVTAGTQLNLPANTFLGLLDTGAEKTCISSQVVQTASLAPIGMRPMISATQSVPVHVYLVDLILPLGNPGFIVPGIEVLEFRPGAGNSFQLLVGRDIIRQGTLVMSADGHFSFCI